MEKIDILSLGLRELQDEMVRIGEKKFRAKQIFQWLHVKRVFDFVYKWTICAEKT